MLAAIRMKASRSRSSMDNSFLGGPELPDVPPLLGSAILFCVYRTGSTPPAWKGWHFASRLVPIQTPRHTPRRSMACIMYTEQVG